jgi:hypothetical protein
MNRLKSKTAIAIGGAVGTYRACASGMAEADPKGETKFVVGAEIAVDGGYSAR